MVTEMGEEHPLILASRGAVVARAQVVLRGGVAVDLVVDEEVDLVVPTTWMLPCWIHDVTNSLTNSSAPGWEGGKERNLD